MSPDSEDFCRQLGPSSWRSCEISAAQFDASASARLKVIHARHSTRQRVAVVLVLLAAIAALVFSGGALIAVLAEYAAQPLNFSWPGVLSRLRQEIPALLAIDAVCSLPALLVCAVIAFAPADRIEQRLRSGRLADELPIRLRTAIVPFGLFSRIGGRLSGHSWSCIAGILETETMLIFLDERDHVVAIVTKAAFDNADEFTRFAAQCRQYQHDAKTRPLPSFPKITGPGNAPLQPRAWFVRNSVRVFAVLALASVIGFGGSMILFTQAATAEEASESSRLCSLATLVMWTSSTGLVGCGVLSVLGAIGGPGWIAAGKQHRLRRLLAKRPDRLVDPDDPKAFFIEFVPRESWSRAMHDHSADGGWLRADPGTNRLAFEGERSRFELAAIDVLSATPMDLPLRFRWLSLIDAYLSDVILMLIRSGGEIHECVLRASRVRTGRWTWSSPSEGTARALEQIAAVLPADRQPVGLKPANHSSERLAELRSSASSSPTPLENEPATVRETSDAAMSSATVITIPPPESGSLTKWERTFANGVVPLLAAVFGGWVALGTSALLLEGLSRSGHRTAASSIFGLVAVACCLVMAAPAVALMINPDWMLKRILKKRMPLRPDRVADGATPADLFVAIIPREAWGERRNPDRWSDFGWLRIEPHAKTVFLEGVAQRWIIPASAISACTVEQVVRDPGRNPWIALFVVLSVRSDWRTIELPLRVATTGVKAEHEIAIERANVVANRIGAIMPGAPRIDEPGRAVD